MPLWKKKKAAEPAAPLDVLRWKIVAVNILFAAMVVATLCFVAARQGKNALEEKHRLAFASLCSALEQPILETQTIDHKAIYSSALENRLVPALFEKGAPIENPYLQGDDAAPLRTTVASCPIPAGRSRHPETGTSRSNSHWPWGLHSIPQTRGHSRPAGCMPAGQPFWPTGRSAHPRFAAPLPALVR